MKYLTLSAIMIAVSAGVSWTSLNSVEVGDPCGVFTLGKYTIDLSKSEVQTALPKDMLIENFQKGLAFAGTSRCPGNYEIIDLHLSIDAARDAHYDYDFDLVRQMQGMESYMLTRYFNDAQKLNFTSIKVKDNAGNILELPPVSFVLK